MLEQMLSMINKLCKKNIRKLKEIYSICDSKENDKFTKKLNI